MLTKIVFDSVKIFLWWECIWLKIESRKNWNSKQNIIGKSIPVDGLESLFQVITQHICILNPCANWNIFFVTFNSIIIDFLLVLYDMILSVSCSSITYTYSSKVFIMQNAKSYDVKSGRWTAFKSELKEVLPTNLEMIEWNGMNTKFQI